MDHRSASITPGGSQFMPDGRSPLNRTRPLDGQRPGGGGPFHSQSIEMRFVKTPGIKCVVPATALGANRLFKASIKDPNPMLFIEQGLCTKTRSLRETLPDAQTIRRRGHGNHRNTAIDLRMV